MKKNVFFILTCLFLFSSCGVSNKRIIRMQKMEEGVGSPTTIEELKTKMVEEYEIPLEQLINQEEQVLEPTKVQKEINILRKNIKDLGNVNVEAIEEYKESKERLK